jgi:carboxypeptidase A2
MIPVANPDGYVYTQTERLWRKSRNVNAASSCRGVDLNRNYDQMWRNAGTSTNTCSDTYGGPTAASEPETQAIQNALVERGSNLIVSIHFHTYGHLWLMPWGSVTSSGACNYADDDAEMLVVANAAADAVQSTYNQATWERGNSCATIYPASGITMDYSKGVAGVKYTFTPELRGNSFIVDSSQIQPSFVEVWNGVLATIRTIEQQQQK